MSVGELIAYNTGRPNHWNLGHIHWAQTGRDGRLSLGIRRINTQAEPVLIGRLSQGRLVDSSLGPALALTAETDDTRAVSLLCNRNRYCPTGTYVVHQPRVSDECVMEGARVLLSTRSFVWFEAREAEGAPPVLIAPGTKYYQAVEKQPDSAGHGALKKGRKALFQHPARKEIRPLSRQK